MLNEAAVVSAIIRAAKVLEYQTLVARFRMNHITVTDAQNHRMKELSEELWPNA